MTGEGSPPRPPSDDPDLELQNRTVEQSIGVRVSHYEIVEELGRGGMGVVYRALDVNLERSVALKSPWPDLVSNRRIRERFLREGRASSQLLHPHIVPVFEVFEHDSVPYMAMEYVDGKSLRDLINATGPLPVPQILRHAEGLADALRTAHEKGILHRDIKPSNILVGSDGRARLADFGLVRFFQTDGSVENDRTKSLSLTEHGARVGTAAYMPPEQMLGKELSPNSDVFSLGAVIYEMCTGRQAFQATSQGEYLDAILHREPDAIARFNYEVPEELVRICRKALAKPQDERYQTAADLLVDVRALRRALLSGSAELSQASFVGPVPSPRSQPAVPTGGKRRLLAGAALLGVAAAAAATAGWWFTRPEPSSAPPPLGHPRQITRGPGWEGEPTISPDGGLIAYSSNASGNADIWMVDIRGGEALSLTEHPGTDRSPAWYPDSSSLAFVSDRNGEVSIWKTPRLGGSEVLIVPSADYPAISPDGTKIAFSRIEPGGQLRIAVAPLDDPADVTVLSGDDHGTWDHIQPAWSPDGGTICYAAFRGLWTVPASGASEPRLLIADQSTDRGPVWSPSGRHIYFSSMREDTLALWRVGADGNGLIRLTLGTGPETDPGLSLDAKRIAYSTFAGDTDLVLLDRSTGLRVPIKSLSVETTPSIARDSSGIVFSSNRRGRHDLWLQPLDGAGAVGEPRLVTDQPGSVSHPTLSPDGRSVAYMRNFEGRRDIWTVALDGGVPARFTEHPANDMQPVWSPDGGRIAFVSDRDGDPHLWIQAIADGEAVGQPTRLTSGKSRDLYPAWSPDGSMLAYVRETEGESDNVWVVSANGSSAPRRVTEGLDTWNVRWEGTGESLLISMTTSDDERAVRRVNLATGAVETPGFEIDFGFPDALGEFDLSADGRWIVYIVENMKGDIWVMDATSGAY